MTTMVATPSPASSNDDRPKPLYIDLRLQPPWSASLSNAGPTLTHCQLSIKSEGQSISTCWCSLLNLVMSQPECQQMKMPLQGVTCSGACAFPPKLRFHYPCVFWSSPTALAQLMGLEECMMPVEPATQPYRISCQRSEGNAITHDFSVCLH